MRSISILANNSSITRRLRWSTIILLLAMVVSAFDTTVAAQSGFGGGGGGGKPQAKLPRVYIDTTWNLPTGGTTWAAHTAAQLTSALASSVPGDTIVLDAGVTYVGNFVLGAKPNPYNKWIYIMSSAIASLPVGVRVSPNEVSNMATIVTPNTLPAFQIDASANHYRLAGLEVTSASSYGCNRNHVPPINCYSYFLIGSAGGTPLPLPDSITIDRSYLHGSPSIDLQRAVLASASNFAVIDSYISDVHMTYIDTQAVLSYWSPGPIKIVNNYLSAAGENIMFGGGGNWNNPYVPSDIQIQNNYLYKPLSWAVPGTGGTLAPNNQWVEKNAFEVKSGQRILFDRNVIQNVWAASQNGFAIVLTVRTSDSGDKAVINDVTITNNILNNVVAGINTLAEDDVCGASGGYPNCHNPGSQDRWNIANNLILFYDPKLPGGLRNEGLGINGGMNRLNNNTPGTLRDVVFQHNTTVSTSSTPCWESMWFSANNQGYPFKVPLTNNLWIVDNALCRQPTGDWGLQGTYGLTNYMGLPSNSPYDLAHRFYGNVMWVQPGDQLQTFPVGNLAQTPAFTYVNPSVLDYQLLTPYWTTTTDGQLSGINNNNLP